MKISIIGAGYVGLVTGACFSKLGFPVTCVDLNQETVKRINEGEAPFYEPGLAELLAGQVKAGLFSATVDLRQAAQYSGVTFVCVGTPMAGDRQIDLSFIIKAIDELSEALKDKKDYHLVVMKSTVVPGTTEKMAERLWEMTGKGAGQVGFCMNPEFLREGSALADFLSPDRIVIGQSDAKAGDYLASLYETMPAQVLRTNLRTAELIKYASNTFFAMLISYSNEMARLAECIGDIDVIEVLSGLILDRRISPAAGGSILSPGLAAYLKAGCGYGGSCFPKDTNALRELSTKGYDYNPLLLDAVIAINERQIYHTVSLLYKEMDPRGKEIAVLGVAFKPDTEDIRESPAIKMIDRLLAGGAKVRICDPRALGPARKHWGERPGVSYCEDPGEALKGAHGAILVTSWPQFTCLEPEDFLKNMATPLLIDGRGVYDREKFSRAMNFRVIGYRPGSKNPA